MLASSAISDARNRLSCSPKVLPSNAVATASAPSVTSVRRRSRLTVARAYCPAVRRVGSVSRTRHLSFRSASHGIHRPDAHPALSAGRKGAERPEKRGERPLNLKQRYRGVGRSQNQADDHDAERAMPTTPRLPSSRHLPDSARARRAAVADLGGGADRAPARAAGRGARGAGGRGARVPGGALARRVPAGRGDRRGIRGRSTATAPSGDRILYEKARRYHAAVRRLRTAVGPPRGGADGRRRARATLADRDRHAGS